MQIPFWQYLEGSKDERREEEEERQKRREEEAYERTYTLACTQQHKRE